MASQSSLPTPDSSGVEKIYPAIRRLRAGWHPLQLRALVILTERVASPKEIAIELGLTKARAGVVSQHVRELEKAGFVEEVRAEPRRGTVEHYFRVVEQPVVTDEEAAQWTEDERDEFSRYIISCIAKDFGMATEYGTLDGDDHVDRHLSRTPLHLDRQGFADLIEAHRQSFHRSLEIQEESDQRRAVSGEEGLPFSSVHATIPMPMVEMPPTNRGS